MAQSDVVIIWQLIWDACTKYCARFLKSEVLGKQHSCLKHGWSWLRLCPARHEIITLPIKGFNIYTIMQHDKAWIETWFFHMHRNSLWSLIKQHAFMLYGCYFGTETNNMPINQKSNYKRLIAHASWENTSTRSQHSSYARYFLIISNIVCLSTANQLICMDSLLHKVNNSECIRWWIAHFRHAFHASRLMTSVKICSPRFCPHPLLSSYRSFQG